MKNITITLTTFIFICFVWIGSVNNLNAQTYDTLSVSRYNTIFSESGSKANGAGSYIFAGRTAGSAGTDIRRGLIYFDLSGIPAGSTIDSAYLKMDMNKTRAGGVTVTLHEITADWGSGTSNASGNEGAGAIATANDATWTCAFADGTGGCNTSWSTSGGDFNTTPYGFAAVSGVGTYTWNLTGVALNLVQRWLDTSATNFGLMVVGDEGSTTTAKRFNGSTIELIVKYTAPSIATVTTDPVDVTICRGFDGSFTIDAINVTTYQWQVSADTGNNWTDLANGGVYDGIATDSLSLTAVVDSMNGYQFRCIVSDGSTSDTSTAANLTVGKIPVVSISPGDTTICEGDSVQLTGANGGNRQWYLNGSPISGATSTTYLATEEGVYNMLKTNNSGCSDSAATGTIITFDTTCNVGIADETTPMEINVFPNPANGHVQLLMDQHVSGQIIITDATGKVHYQSAIRNVQNLTVSTTNWAEGLYFIRIQNGLNSTYSQKLMIRK